MRPLFLVSLIYLAGCSSSTFGSGGAHQQRPPDRSTDRAPAGNGDDGKIHPISEGQHRSLPDPDTESNDESAMNPASGDRSGAAAGDFDNGPSLDADGEFSIALGDGGTSSDPNAKCLLRKAGLPLTPGSGLIDGTYVGKVELNIAALTAKYPSWYRVTISADGNATVNSKVAIAYGTNSIEFSNPTTPVGDDSILSIGRDGLCEKSIAYPSPPVGIERIVLSPPMPDDTLILTGTSRFGPPWADVSYCD